MITIYFQLLFGGQILPFFERVESSAISCLFLMVLFLNEHGGIIIESMGSYVVEATK